MKKTNVHSQKGIAQLVILSIMGVLAIVLPVATKLVQQNQENRSKAAGGSTCSSFPGDIGNKACNGDKVKTCQTTNGSTVQWVTSSSPCTYGCSGGACKPAPAKVCTANTQYKCDGRNLMKCNSSGTAWTLSRECGIDQTCNATTKTCDQKETKICTPNTYICNNSTLKKCNSDGTATSVIQPCSKGCNSSGNACLACTADEKPICTVDGKVGVCSSGNWDYKTCPSGQVCSGGACVTIQVCTPNSTKCMDNNTSVDKCKADGSGWITNWDDCNATEECKVVGSESKCVAKPICTANTQYKCNGKILEQCNSSGTGWTTKQTCGTNESCYADEKECRKDNCPTTSLVGKVLTPGQKACGTESTNKNYLYTCNAGNDVARDVCPGTCSNGACVAAANKINGLCNENITAAPTISACLSGTFKDQPDYSGHWVWDCEGANGGTTAHCNITTVATGCNAANVGAKKCNATTKTITTCKSVKNMEDEFEYLYTSPITCSNGCTQSTTKDAICNSTTSCSYNGNSYPIGQKICQDNVPTTCLSTGSWNNSAACKYGCSGNGVCKSAPSGNTGGGDTGGGETPATPETPVTLTGIKLSPNPLYLVIGKSWKVGVETIPGGLTSEYTWKSDDANIASVDMLGNVTGVTLGETYITATAKGTTISDKIKVVVDPDGSVTPEACTGYVYDEWSDCKNGTQTRNMLSKTPDGCTGNPSYAPVTTQECSDVAISYKIAFAGILPGAKCIDEYLIPETRIETDVANIPSIASGKYTDKIQTSFEETDETDFKGNRIFQVTNLVLDKDKFGSVNNFNYVKIKGPWHLKRRMCQDGQGKKMPESTACDINLKANSGKVYDFSEYTLLAGDITADGSKRGDGVINSLDLGYIKTRLNPGSGVNCGREGDLNMDGVVNSIDLNLVKTSLTERDDE